MSVDLTSILDKLVDQGAKIDAQGAEIAKLVADRDAKEQADLDRIMALIDANGSKTDANAAKMTAALALSSDAGASQGSGAAPVTTVLPDSGTTTTVDPASGTTVILDHATGQTSAVDAAGSPAPTDPALAAAALAATQDAGISVPAA